jgi:hypothetical protein
MWKVGVAQGSGSRLEKVQGVISAQLINQEQDTLPPPFLFDKLATARQIYGSIHLQS